MTRLKTFILFVGIVLLKTYIMGQAVPKNILVEHFTNTRCSVCASRNPGFYNALNQKPEVLHIAYHPSSPYSNCLFSTQNKTENDARTNFYGLYGATPTFAINGQEKSGNEVQSPSVYTPYENKTTPISVLVNLEPAGIDSIRVIVTAAAVAPHNLTNVSLYVPLVEELVNYAAPNGESVHHDVFRKSFTGTNAVNFIAPAFNGSPYIYTSKLAKNIIWDQDKLYAIAIVQQTDKAVVQSQASALFDKNVLSSTDEKKIDPNVIIVSPNPANGVIFLSSSEFNDILIHEITGKEVLKKSKYDIQNGIDISMLKTGTYFLRCKRKDGKRLVTRFIKQ